MNFSNYATLLLVGILSYSNAFEQPISHVRGNKQDDQKDPLSIHVNGVHRELAFGLGLGTCQANLATCQEKKAGSVVIIDGLKASFSALGLEDSEAVAAINTALISASKTDFSAMSGASSINVDIEQLLKKAEELPETTTPTTPFGDFYGSVLLAIETVLNTLIKSLDAVYSVGLSPLTDFITAVRKVIEAVPSGGTKLMTTVINEVITYIGKFIVYIVGITVAARSPELLSEYASCASQALQCEFDLMMMNAVPGLAGEAYLAEAVSVSS